MTIKELYNLAKENGYEDFTLGYTVNNTEFNDIMDKGSFEDPNEYRDSVKITSSTKEFFFQIYVRS